MITPTLAERFQHIITHFAGGNLTAFARRVGLSQSTLHRNLKSEDEQLLLGLVGWVLLALPTLSRRWLLHGEGEMLLAEEEQPSERQCNEGQRKDAQRADAPDVDDSIIEHLHYVIECQKHTLEIQTRLLEIHSKDFLKNAAALGNIGAAQSLHGHSD